MRTIPANELEQRLRDGEPFQLIDVRTPAEHAGSRMPGSVNVPLDALASHTDVLVASGAPVVIVCASGRRAVVAAEWLARHRGDVAVLDGGLDAWRDLGGELHSLPGVWAMERQIRFTAGSLVLLGLALSLVLPQAVWLAAFVGGGLVFSALTNTCAMGVLLSRMPWNSAAACTVPAAPSPDSP